MISIWLINRARPLSSEYVQLVSCPRNAKAYPRADFRISENLFLKSRSHAILLLRPPMTRIRPCHARPEIPPLDVEPAAGRAEASNARGRLSPIAEAARLSNVRAVGHRTAARGPLMLGFASAMRRLKRRARGAGWDGGKIFLPASKRNRIGIPTNPPMFRGSRCNGGDRFAEPEGVATPRPSSASFGKTAGRRDGGVRNFPIHKPLKRLETAKESR